MVYLNQMCGFVLMHLLLEPLEKPWLLRTETKGWATCTIQVVANGEVKLNSPPLSHNWIPDTNWNQRPWTLDITVIIIGYHCHNTNWTILKKLVGVAYPHKHRWSAGWSTSRERRELNAAPAAWTVVAVILPDASWSSGAASVKPVNRRNLHCWYSFSVEVRPILM